MADTDFDNGPVTKRTHNFFLTKSIQRSYNYFVYFSKSDKLANMLRWTSDDIEQTLDMYATSVELPSGYEFKKEYYEIGNFKKSFPVYDHNGFEFTIKMEEDAQGSVKYLIGVLNEAIINSGGYYNGFKNSVIDDLEISVYRHDGTNIYRAHFENVYLMKASTPTYSYNSNEKIEYDLTFNADHFHVEWGTAARNSNYQAPL